MQLFKKWFHILVSRIKKASTHSAGYYTPYAFYIGLIGVIGFPIYFLVWSYIFPQPYESITLRLVGTVLFLGLSLHPIWPNWLRKYTSCYWLAIMTFALPFFFIFMWLMNGGNTAWAMSTMAGIALLIMVSYDWVLFSIMLSIGAFFAVTAFSLSTHNFVFPEDYLQQLSIYLFLILTGGVTFYYPNRIKEEKLKVLRSIGAEISHELRTPLMTIKNNVTGLNKHLPNLIECHDIAKSNHLIEHPIRPDIFNALKQSTKNIENEITHSNTIIEMLLMNLAQAKIDTTQFSVHVASHVVQSAINRYPFDSEYERDAVELEIQDDFKFLGSEILLVHVVFNLIKNAIVFTKSSTKASIKICLKRHQSNNVISFKDNGDGIGQYDRLSIFDSFYSSGYQTIGTGSGIGLAFCKKVMLSFSGDIKCNSEVGKYTEFVLSFPTEDSRK